MNVMYEIYRAKNNDLITGRKFKVPLTNDDHLAKLDEIISYLMAKNIQEIDVVKSFGTGYIGNIIAEVEITDEDNIEMTEEQFRFYFSHISSLPVKWSKTTTVISNENKPPENETGKE